MSLLKRLGCMLALLFTMLYPTAASAGGLLAAESDFLPPGEAFRLVTSVDGNSLVAEWAIEPGYYLYKDRFEIAFLDPVLADSMVEPVFDSPGDPKEDEYFGLVQVYHDNVRLEIPLDEVLSSSAGTAGLASGIEVAITYQGCADAGLCYPPQTENALFLSSSEGQATGGGGDGPTSPVQIPPDPDSAGSLAASLMGGSFIVNLGLFFLLGVGLAFTPCVLPMVPILSSIIAGQRGTPSTTKSFFLSLSYVLGMAVTYALAGVVVGYFGAAANIQSALQNPFVLGFFSLMFVVLALAMFGLFELQLPAALRDRLYSVSQKQSGGTLAGVAGMGALSALVVSPCVTAPLTGVLIYISTTQDALYGGLVLFTLALGMGLPLLILGTGGGKLLPKAGAWLDSVKAVFGVMLLGVAIWLLERVLPGSLVLALWGLLAGVTAVYLGAFDSIDSSNASSGTRKLQKGLGLVLFVYAVALLIGSAAGGRDPLSPLERFATQGLGGGTSFAINGSRADGNIEVAARSTVARQQFMTVRTPAELSEALASAAKLQRPAMLDFYADWCISCKVMERQVFPHPEVAAKLANMALIKVDITSNDAGHKAILNSYGLFGPPAILFFDSSGTELENFRIVGEIDLEPFSQHLSSVLDTGSELSAAR